MMQVAFAIPGDISRPTGGYAYARHVLRLLPEFGVEPLHLALPGSFPNPSDADLAETSRILLTQDWQVPLLIDGLAYGAFPAGMAAGLAGRVIALCHHPLALETGTVPERAAELMRLETAALGYASAVIVTSVATRDLLIGQFHVDPAKMTVAEPGVEASRRAGESAFGGAQLAQSFVAAGEQDARGRGAWCKLDGFGEQGLGVAATAFVGQLSGTQHEHVGIVRKAPPLC